MFKKSKKVLATTAFSTLLLSGCSGMSTDGLVESSMLGFKALTFSDAEARDIANGACAEMDSQARIAPAGNKYAKRLNNISNRLGHSVDGVNLNYKVYQTNDVIAWAMANGCIRVYSGLMDLMTDNEIEGVLGHEIGHVLLGHTKKHMQVAYASAAARTAAASSTNASVSTLSRSQLGDLGQKLVDAQFSQSQETKADNFSFELLTKRNIKREGLVTAFDKLAKLGGGESSMFSSHPGATARSASMQQRIDQQKSK